MVRKVRSLLLASTILALLGTTPAIAGTGGAETPAVKKLLNAAIKKQKKSKKKKKKANQRVVATRQNAASAIRILSCRSVGTCLSYERSRSVSGAGKCLRMGPATSRTYSVWTTPSPFEIRVNQPGAAELVYPATSGRTNDRMSFPLPLDIPSMTEVNRFFSVYNNNTQLAQLRLSRNANETMFGRGANVISHEDDFNPEDMLACTPETAATFNGGAVVLTNSANYLPLISKDSIASAWAIRLADGEAFPSSAPLPTTLGGIQALLNGVPAALSYVSKTQVNAIVPPNLGSRLQNSSRIDGKVVEVRVVGSDGLRAIGSVATAVTSPGLFAGYRLGDYAVVFGTGFRYFRDDPCYSDARVTFNGTATALPTYVGAQGEMLGLDQVNVLIPESLRSAASVSVELSFNPSCAYAFGAARSNRITVPLR